MSNGNQPKFQQHAQSASDDKDADEGKADFYLGEDASERKQIMWPLLLGGLALGGVKSILDSSGRDSDKKVQAATTRYSPWTGMKAPEPRQVDAIGNLMKGGLTGAMIANIGQNAGWFGGASKGAGSMSAAANAGPNLGIDYSNWPGMNMLFGRGY